MKRHSWLLWGLVAWELTLTGCSLTKPRPAVHHYALALTVPNVPGRLTKMSLIVRSLTARDPYDQEPIVYRTSPYTFDVYNYHRWASSPAEQITEWTRRYLSGIGLFDRVFPTTEGIADLTLGGVIRQFEEIDHEKSWDAALSIDFWLTRAGEPSPFWLHSYTATQQATKRNPEAIAEAMSRCLEEVLQQLTTDLKAVVTAPSP